MLRFQEPGLADAEMDADVAATMRGMFAGQLAGPPSLPDWISADEFEHYVTEFSRTGFTGGLNWYRNYDRNWESTPQLAGARITVPALFIGGTADPIGPTMRPDRAREVAAGPYSEKWIEGAGHWVQQERPDDVNRILVGIPTGSGAVMTGRPLRFGVFITPFHPVGQSPTAALEYDLERTVALDRLGFDEAWFGEHHSGGYELIACPEVFIATAAERTKHIRLGTGVVSLPYHHPLMVADRWVLLDHLTRGRAMFGTGPGALPSDAYMMGIDPVEQRRMMQESLEAILALFRAAPDERVSRHSDWFTLRDAQLHIRPYTWPYPEISTAAMISPSGPRLAGALGTSLLSLSMSVPGGYAALENTWQVVVRPGREVGPRRTRPRQLAGAVDRAPGRHP